MFEHIPTNISDFIDRNPQGVVVLRGATATGKTGLSVELGRFFGGSESPLAPLYQGGDAGGFKRGIEIISADSRQIYRYMDVGTDKISKEIRDEIPHHMIDIVDPDETYTAGQWKQDVEVLIPQIHARGNIPIVVGGTGLYIDMLYKNFSMPDVAPDLEWRAMMESKEADSPGFLHRELSILDPEEAMKHHPNSLRYILRALEICIKTGQKKSELACELPVQWPLLMIGLWREKEDTNRRINARIKHMLADGMLMQENKQLLAMGYNTTHTAMNGIGYKEMIGYIQGEYGIDRCEELLKRNTHRYAKRQRSRFRRYIGDMNARPKENVEYELVEINN